MIDAELLLKWAYVIGAFGIILTESVMIWQLIKLRKSVDKMNKNLENTYNTLLEKIKGLISLFLQSQSNKITGNVTITKDDDDWFVVSNL
ncbi:MAG: hypothetical protein Q8O89_05520, partial [Nanoarchaeota archaeon]|nr:hypothetical protein [Nanoarchaeota archaeon]